MLLRFPSPSGVRGNLDDEEAGRRSGVYSFRRRNLDPDWLIVAVKMLGRGKLSRSAHAKNVNSFEFVGCTADLKGGA